MFVPPRRSGRTSSCGANVCPAAQEWPHIQWGSCFADYGHAPFDAAMCAAAAILAVVAALAVMAPLT